MALKVPGFAEGREGPQRPERPEDRCPRAGVDGQRGQAAGVVVVEGHRQVEVDRVVKGLLLEEWQDHASPRPAGPEVDAILVLLVHVAGVGHKLIGGADVARREDAHRLHIVVQRQADLFEIVHASGAPGRLASILHGRKQERDQDSDDRDDDEAARSGVKPRSAFFHRLIAIGLISNNGCLANDDSEWARRGARAADKSPVGAGHDGEPATSACGSRKRESSLRRRTGPASPTGSHLRAGQAPDERCSGADQLLVSRAA